MSRETDDDSDDQVATRAMGANDRCPRCRGHLDMGWACSTCGEALVPVGLPQLPPLAPEDQAH